MPTKDMAVRLASAGYYVMLPYLFYRGGPYREFGTSDEDMHARRELMATVTPTNILGDAEALLAAAADDPAAGAWLVLDGGDSPHLHLDRAKAEMYFAWCDDDPIAPVDDLETMRKALEAAGVTHMIDFITDAVHGFAPPGSDRYDRRASELHWERVHSLLRRNLR